MTYRRLALITLASTAVFVIAFIAFDHILGDSLIEFGVALVDDYGLAGLFLTFMVSAVCVVPIPDHAISVLAWLGGVDTIANVAVATLGSASGATIAFVAGKSLGRIRRMRGLLFRHESKSRLLLARYGAAGIIIACATPFPYSPVCWLAGILGYRYQKFIFLVLFFRAFKVIYVLLLTQLGFSIL